MDQQTRNVLLAANRVVLTEMSGVGVDTPIARAIFGLALACASAGLLRDEEDGTGIAKYVTDDAVSDEIARLATPTPEPK